MGTWTFGDDILLVSWLGLAVGKSSCLFISCMYRPTPSSSRSCCAPVGFSPGKSCSFSAHLCSRLLSLDRLSFLLVVVFAFDMTVAVISEDALSAPTLPSHWLVLLMRRLYALGNRTLKWLNLSTVSTIHAGVSHNALYT